LIADEIIAKLEPENGAILDIGTGLGSLAIEFAKRLPESKIIGIDISQEMLTEARKNSQAVGIDNTEFRLCDAQKIDFPDNFFALIISFGVLHHLKDLKKTFSEIKRVLKPNCPAYIYDLRKDSPQDVVEEIANSMNPEHKRAFLESVKEAFTPNYLEAVLKNLHVKEYSLSQPKYSRRTIIKNKDLLRRGLMMGERFNSILIECFLRK
jgi:ubiquinone/menaquinone biosynthesis C-methylase UbiE